jgi:AcrR family transcriptional regulator
VVRAALEVLADRGLPGFSIEAVAQRAGASKATVYRHWRSPGALLVDTMDLSFRPFPPAATGALRTDLIELVSRLQELLVDQHFPRLMAAFMDAAERDPALKDLHVELTERRRDLIRHVLVEARQRGEIPPGADIELAVDLLAGPAFYRRFVAHRAFTHDYASAVVDHVLAALRSSS